MVHERVPIHHLAEGSPQWVEDVERYRFAARFVSGQRVLDVACGTGYGSRLLASAGGARYVVGADLDSQASVVRTFHLHGQVDFISADCCRLPLGDGTMDAVVSMETIEHLTDANAYLSEVRRVLKPSGTAIVSTPVNNGDTRYKPENPYHVREYSCEEFQALLERTFTAVTVWSQVTAFHDDAPRWSLGPAAARFKKLLKLVLPHSGRKAVRTMLGSAGLHAVESRIVSGRHEHAGVQIGVCG